MRVIFIPIPPIYCKIGVLMDESVFRSAMAAVSSGIYDETDIKVIKWQLENLNKKELSIKRQMEKNRNDFVKKKNKNETELKTVRNDIRTLKNFLKGI